jgi:hypothetical protein
MILQSSRRRAQRRWWFIGGISVLSVVLIIAASIPFWGYYRTHDIPNPIWGIFDGSYQYVPPQTPPAALAETPPDQVLLQFLHDYISLAGTYPCATDLQQYDFEQLYHSGRDDPIYQKQPCPIQRPIQMIAITHVFIGHVRGLETGGHVAKIDLHIQYSNGEQLHHTFELSPGKSDMYFLHIIHYKCWLGIGIDRFYLMNGKITITPKGSMGSPGCPYST